MAAVWSLIHKLEEHEGEFLLACHVIAALAYGRSDFATMLPIRPDVRNRVYHTKVIYCVTAFFHLSPIVYRAGLLIPLFAGNLLKTPP